MSIHLHIVPSIPPAFNGLGDYCYQLWKHWPLPRPDWHVAAAVVPIGSRETWPEAQIHGFEPTANSLLEVIRRSKAETVVLHYVGYGYEKRGAPGWLPKALSDWKRKSGGKLIIMFHELYATGPPWKSEFWLCLPQKGIACQLAKLADRWITSCPRYVRVLCEVLGVDASKGEMIPVCSNIEPAPMLDKDKSWPLDAGGKIRIAVFGLPLTRFRAINAHKELLKALVQRDFVAEVVLIGKSEKAGPIALETNQLINAIGQPTLFVEAPDLSAEDISQRLSMCQIGLIQNSFDILYKSGVYSAFAVHGVLPVIPSSKGNESGNFLTNDESRPADTISHMAAAYYAQGDQGNDFLATSVARKFAAVCRENGA